MPSIGYFRITPLFEAPSFKTLATRARNRSRRKGKSHARH